MSRQFGERCLTRATNTDKHSATSSCVDSTCEPEQMGESIVENNEGHFLRRVLLVIGIELLVSNALDKFVGGASFVNEGCFLNNLAVLIHDIFAHEVSELELGKDL